MNTDNKFKKIVKWNVVAFHEHKALETIEGDQVAFISDEHKRIVISIDKETGKIAVYKMGYNEDQIEILPLGTNRVLIS